MGHGRLRVWLIALARPARRRRRARLAGLLWAQAGLFWAQEPGRQAERFLRCIRYSGAVVR